MPARWRALDEGDTRTATWSHVGERAAPLAADTWIGRYRIVALLGSGGLGRVYRAHDPALARDIALKVLHRRFEPDTAAAAPHQRLLREGQALARLSHPNVVTVYDVGIQDDVVFIAMELVHGQTLAAWLQARPARAEVLGVLLAAGRGLAAAHAAALVHGDFKPANVMLSREGQVRIVDFGLAHAIGDDGGGERGAGERGAGERGGLERDRSGTRHTAAGESSAAVTHATVLRGTPGYIAPELLQGQATADALADQYSFAVTAFVALTGRKPHEPPPPSQAHGAPARVLRVIERGMAPHPAQRHASLDALLAALERAAKPRLPSRARLALAMGAALLVGGAALARSGTSGALCEVDAAPFAGVWDAARRAEVERSLLATGRPNAAEAFALLAGRLDAFEARWLEMQRDACEASLISGTQPERVFALRSRCLKHKLGGFAALVDAFAHSDARSVDRAAGVVPEPLQDCADVATLTGVADALPEDPEKRAAIDAISSGVAVVGAEIAAGRDGRARARQLHEAAVALGHKPAIAIALTWVGRSMVASDRGDGSLVEAKNILHEAMRLAAEVGDRHLLAVTASYMLNIVAFREKRTAEGDAMLPMVDALVNQGGNEPELRLEVLVSQGAILTQRGQYLDAIEVFERAVELSREVPSQRKAYGAFALGQIGDNYIELRRYPEALRSRQAELEGIRSIYGARHPRVMSSLFHLGIAQVETGRLDEARASAASLRELGAQLLGPDDWRQAMLLFLEGNIAQRGGDCATALPLYRMTLDKVSAFYGPDHNNTADVYERLGSCLHATGQSREGAAQLERALAVRRALGSAPRTAEVAFQLAKALWALSGAERRRAIALAEEAVSLWGDNAPNEERSAAVRWLAERARTSPARRPAPAHAPPAR